MYLRLLSAVTRREVLVNLDTQPLIDIEYANTAGQQVDAIVAKSDPTAVRVFTFTINGEKFRVRSTDDSPAVRHLCKLYDEAIK